MRILLIHRYYSPDVGAYPLMLQKMAERFSAQAHRVTVFSVQPGYNNVTTEKLPRRVIENGVEVYRISLFKENKKNVALRALNVLLFLMQLILHSIMNFRRYDLMTVGSFPPTVTAMVVRWISRINGNRYVYHCQDIYPEIAQVSGIIEKNWISKLALAIDRKNCQRADAVVTLSDDMATTLRNRGLGGDNIHVINNFVIDRFNPEVEVDASFAKSQSTFRVLFAGNFGRFQHLEEVLEAAILLKDCTDLCFFFVGTGAIEKRLIRQASEAGVLNETVFFRPFQRLEKIMRVIHDSDLAIVSLSPGVIRCAYPSKTMTYLESGCRLLGLLEADSQLAHLIRSRKLGAVSSDLTSQGICDAVHQEYALSKRVKIDKSQIQTVGQELFGQDAILKKWDCLIDSLDQSQMAYDSNQSVSNLK